MPHSLESVFYSEQFAGEEDNISHYIIEEAMKLIGLPAMRYDRERVEYDYSYGSLPETGFDCSGYVRYVLDKTGIVIPQYITLDNIPKVIRHVNEFFDHFGIYIQDGKQQEGDLVFFSAHGLRPTHMGIVLDQNRYIHSPGVENKMVCIDDISHQTIQARDYSDQLYEANPIGFKRPTIFRRSPRGRWTQTPI